MDISARLERSFNSNSALTAISDLRTGRTLTYAQLRDFTSVKNNTDDAPEEDGINRILGILVSLRKGLSPFPGPWESENVSCLVDSAISVGKYRKYSRVVTMLPCEDTFNVIFGILAPLACGAEILLADPDSDSGFLTRICCLVRPDRVFISPQQMEHISGSLPEFHSAVGQVGLVRLKKRLMQLFGGKISEVCIAGFGIDDSTAETLKRSGFPFTVGTCISEYGPVISFQKSRNYRHGSCGILIGRQQVRTLGTCSDLDKSGEICIRWHDGWLRTGLHGLIEPDGTIFLKGN